VYPETVNLGFRMIFGFGFLPILERLAVHTYLVLQKLGQIAASERIKFVYCYREKPFLTTAVYLHSQKFVYKEMFLYEKDCPLL
jgi:hypothetical protein